MTPEGDIPEFALTTAQLARIPMIIDYVADYMPDIYRLLDKAQQMKLFNVRMKYRQQLQAAQLDFHKRLVEIHQNFVKEVSGMLG